MTEAVGGIVTFFNELMWCRLLPKLCIDELHVVNDIKATCVFTLNQGSH